MESKKEKRLRLWKARQEAEGYDVSGVTTLEQAEHFFDKKDEPAAEPEIPEIPEVDAEPEIPEVPESPKKKGKKAKEV